VGWEDARFEPGTAGQQSGALPLSYHASLLSYHASLLSYHASLLSYHASLLSYHASLLSCHASLLSYHAFLLSYHASLLSYHASLLLRIYDARLLNFKKVIFKFSISFLIAAITYSKYLPIHLY
jgi:hypothetical protein